MDQEILNERCVAKMQVLLHVNMNEILILSTQPFLPDDISDSVWQCCTEESLQGSGRLNEWPQ